MFLENLNWRNATKKFDINNPVSDAQLERVLSAIRMAPSSFGLQPFNVCVVRDPQIRAQMQKAGWGQQQFTTATAILVFVADTNVVARIEEMMQSLSGGDPSARAKHKELEEMMVGFVKGLSGEGLKAWTQRQAYIALGFGLAACAELKIASCPMEGFVPEEFDKILNLPKGQFASVVLAVGNAAPDFTPYPKFRYSQQTLFHKV